MLAENHVMQVLYKKNFYSMIKSCYARFYMRNMYLKSCYGSFIGTTKNIMLGEIMLWKYHVRRSLAVLEIAQETFVKAQITMLKSKVMPFWRAGRWNTDRKIF